MQVGHVNHAPSFTKGSDQSILEDAGAQSVSGWATSLSAGPAEDAGQTLTFLVSTNNDALFSALPLIDAFGNLTYTAADNANGSATVTVKLMDNGGTDNNGSDTSGPQTFSIAVAAVNDVPSFNIASNPPSVLEDPGSIASGPRDRNRATPRMEGRRDFLVSTNNDTGSSRLFRH